MSCTKYQCLQPFLVKVVVFFPQYYVFNSVLCCFLYFCKALVIVLRKNTDIITPFVNVPFYCTVFYSLMEIEA